MELVFRALNDIDVLCDPIKNGIASKMLLYDLTKTHLEATESKFLSGLSKKEKEEYIRSNIKRYVVLHQGRLDKKFLKRNLPIKNVINSFVINKDKYSYYQLLYLLSSLNNHLVNGSKVYTNWISVTTNFDSMFKYYDKQDKHQVLVANIPTNGVYNESTLVVDVSDKERIEKLRCLSKKIAKIDVDNFIKLISSDSKLEEISNNLFHEFIFQRTDKKFMGYNFSKASHEVSVYNYLDSSYILGVLEQLQIDLICADRFNLDYLTYSAREQKRILMEFKDKLRKKVVNSNDSFMLYVFEQLYLENKNIEYISKNEVEKNRIKLVRNKILTKSLMIPSDIVKK